MECDEYPLAAETQHITNKQLKKDAKVTQHKVDQASANAQTKRQEQAAASRKVREAWRQVEHYDWDSKLAYDCASALATFFRTKNNQELFLLLGDSNVRRVGEQGGKEFQDAHKIIYYLGIGSATLETWIEVLLVFKENDFHFPKAWRGVGIAVGANRKGHPSYAAEMWVLMHEMLLTMHVKFVFHLPLFCTRHEVEAANQVLTSARYRDQVLFFHYCTGEQHVHMRESEKIEWITQIARSVRARWALDPRSRSTHLPHLR